MAKSKYDDQSGNFDDQSGPPVGPPPVGPPPKKVPENDQSAPPLTPAEVAANREARKKQGGDIPYNARWRNRPDSRFE